MMEDRMCLKKKKNTSRCGLLRNNQLKKEYEMFAHPSVKGDLRKETQKHWDLFGRRRVTKGEKEENVNSVGKARQRWVEENQMGLYTRPLSLPVSHIETRSD